VASTKMVMVGAVADQLKSGNKTRETTPKILESFIDRAPHECLLTEIDEPMKPEYQMLMRLQNLRL